MSGTAFVEAERQALDKYLRENQVEGVVQEIIRKLLAAKPDKPRQWLLNELQKELSNDSNDLSESELQRLFASTRKISSEIVPKDAIDIVIKETAFLLHCDRVSLFVFDKKTNMLRLYASNLLTPIMVNPGQGIVGSAFNAGEVVNIPDCYQDPRFDKAFDQSTGYVSKSLIAVPILDYEGSPIGVIQVINKLPASFAPGAREQVCGAGMSHTDTHTVCQVAVPFEKSDEKILLHLTQHVGIAMRNAEVYREAISASERATGLLNTIQSLSQDLGTQSMLLTITMHANKIVSAERSTVFLLDEQNQQLWSVSADTGEEIRIPKKHGIVGQCCTEGKVVNISDAYTDCRFNQDVDKQIGFKTQSVLAVPIFEDTSSMQRNSTYADTKTDAAPDGDGDHIRVVGVIEMINKVSFDGQLGIFDDSDVEVMEVFAKTVGPKLALSSMVARRHSENPDKVEAELALGQNMDQFIGASHRLSSKAGALVPVGEVEEEAEDDTT